jgi:hypothetical protein
MKLFTIVYGDRYTLLLLPTVDGLAAISNLSEIAIQAAKALPDVFSAHLILKSATTEALPANLNSWINTDETIYKKLHVTRPTLILMRPDGYIAAAASGKPGADRLPGQFPGP